MVKRRVYGFVSSKWFHVRCTERELLSWHRFAAFKGKKLSDMVRDSLNRQSQSVCLCVVGEEMCEKCRLEKAEKDAKAAGP